MKAHPTIDKAISRRSLIGSVLAAIPALGLKSKELLQEPAAPAGPNARIKEYRRLGRTGFNVSDIGFGDCVCPSMSTFEDIDNFIALSGCQMKAGDRALLADYRGISGDFYCRHACGICETACPQGIPVNTIMRYDYYFKAKRQEKMAMAEYANLGSCNAASCFDCGGACVKACPYGVPIQAKLILAHDTLSIP